MTSASARPRAARARTGLAPGPGRDRRVSLAWPRLPAAAEVAIIAAGYFGYTLVRLAVRVISHDEDNHLAYCHEELLRLAPDGYGAVIRATLRAAALAEIAIYRDVSRAVIGHLGQILGWRRPTAAVLAAGIRGVYACERLGGWRRMVALRMPSRRNALGGPVPAQPSYA